MQLVVTEYHCFYICWLKYSSQWPFTMFKLKHIHLIKRECYLVNTTKYCEKLNLCLFIFLVTHFGTRMHLIKKSYPHSFNSILNVLMLYYLMLHHCTNSMKLNSLDIIFNSIHFEHRVFKYRFSETMQFSIMYVFLLNLFIYLQIHWLLYNVIRTKVFTFLKQFISTIFIVSISDWNICFYNSILFII